VAKPTNRTELKDYCLRKLGFPVIDINVDDDQVDDRIDDALQKYAAFHYDASIPDYLAIRMTPEMLANGSNIASKSSGGEGSNSSVGNTTYGWVPLPDNVIGVNKIFPITGDTVHGGGSSANFNIFDLNYQLRLNELYEFTSSSYQYYWIARTHIRMLELILVGQNPVRFSKHMNRLYLDMHWNQPEIPANSYFLIECTRVLDPVEFPKIMNDEWLKEYSTQLIKKQWSSNLIKYGNYTLPGGMIINGEKMYVDAITEIARLEAELRSTWELPPEMLLG
jgi:hypothetical protein